MTCSRHVPTFPLVVVALLLSLDASWAETSDSSTPRSDGSSCARATFRVVLDVGHTADAPGAMSARGTPEYEFNIRLAKQIEQKLSDAGFRKTVLLITAGPAIKGMYQRVARANSSSADPLLSIHHDAVPDSFLEKWEYEGKPATFSDRFKGHSIFVSHGNINRKASLLFGNLLGNQLKARGLQYTPHYTERIMGKYRRELLDAETGVYQYDTLFVLKKSRMPAVLLEAGSIVNRDDELLLGSTEHQLLISAAVVDAVEVFCVAQSRRHSPQLARSRPRHPPKRTADTAPVTTWVQPGIDVR